MARRQLGERRVAPERERVVEQGGTLLVVVDRARLGALPDEALEVEDPGLELQDVAGRARAQRNPVGPERLAQARDVDLERGAAVSGAASPQRSSISRSVGTTRFAFRSSSASTARCLRGPRSTSAPSRTASTGPRSRNWRPRAVGAASDGRAPVTDVDSSRFGGDLAAFWPRSGAFGRSSDTEVRNVRQRSQDARARGNRASSRSPSSPRERSPRRGRTTAVGTASLRSSGPGT